MHACIHVGRDEGSDSPDPALASLVACPVAIYIHIHTIQVDVQVGRQAGRYACLHAYR